MRIGVEHQRRGARDRKGSILHLHFWDLTPLAVL